MRKTANTLIRRRLKNSILRPAILASLVLSVSSLPLPARADEATQLEELRNTVINLLDGLVQKGVLTREQAQAMVASAQEKAAAQAKAKADQDAAEKDAVRVTYVPEAVRKQISEQVRNEIRPEVTKEVIEQAKKDKWGVPGALPDWIGRISFSGDLRVRAQYDDFAAENYTDYCQALCNLDYFAINNRGGYTLAGLAAYTNTTEDRLRERVRLRFAASAKLSTGVSANFRIATGNLIDPVSTNQTFGNSNGRYQIGLDQAYLRYDAGAEYNPRFPWLTATAGRMPNPFAPGTELVWDQDLQFDGVALTGRVGLGGRPSNPRNIFLTVGAFPLQEIELSPRDKWLYGTQLGFAWPLGSRENEGVVRLSAAYYYYSHITGIRNSVFGSRLNDFTAPQWMQKGNTLFDIRNDQGTTNLFALAAEYRIVNGTLTVELPVGMHKLFLNADYAKNVGYDEQDVLSHAPLTSDGTARVNGYQMELGFGTKGAREFGDWRASLGYRYVQRDAVLDAFTDSDFHLGGTDAKGYQLRAEWWARDRLSIAMRYLSANEIDGQANSDSATEVFFPTQPFGVDTFMLDINGQF